MLAAGMSCCIHIWWDGRGGGRGEGGGGRGEGGGERGGERGASENSRIQYVRMVL